MTDTEVGAESPGQHVEISPVDNVPFEGLLIGKYAWICS